MLLLGACEKADRSATPGSDTPAAEAETPGTKAMTIQLTSSAFANGQTIPKQHTADGQDVSPPLSWSALPDGTKELALICDDPDAPRPEPWVHWVIYKVPADITSLPEGVEKTHTPPVPAGALQGKNSFNKIGYGGPSPPRGHGRHRYYFRLYALDAELAVDAGLNKDALLEAMRGHVLAEGELVGLYER